MKTEETFDFEPFKKEAIEALNLLPLSGGKKIGKFNKVLNLTL